MWLRTKRPKTGINWALRFYTRVLKLHDLHFGLWNPGMALTVMNLQEAQENYNLYLKSFFPSDVIRVLDVGCGTGSISKLLLSAGYDMQGVSPDPDLGNYYRTTTQGRTPFHQGRFEDLRDLGQDFDLILMAESCQYIKPKIGLEQAGRFLRQGGYLLISDFFVKRKKEIGCRVCRSGHELEGYTNAAHQAGFVLKRKDDITTRVLPTLDLALLLYQQHVDPALDLARAYLQERHPWLLKVGHRVLQKRISSFEDSLLLLNSAAFARCKNYLILLFQRS